MKNLQSLEELKQFSIALQQFLATKDITIKHSLMLEAIAKANNYHDWNTLSVTLQNKKLSEKEPEFTYHQKIHFVFGFSYFSYDISNHYLKIETHTHEQLSSTHLFKLSPQSIEKINTDLIKLYQLSLQTDNIDEFFHNYKMNKDKDTLFGFKNKQFIVSDSHSSLAITDIFAMPLIKELIDFFNKIIPSSIEFDLNAIYPLSPGLLNSMAMRYDHSFGIMEPEQRSELLDKMKELYELYKNGLDDETISKQLNIYIVSVKQVRQETNGEGFFQPK